MYDTMFRDTIQRRTLPDYIVLMKVIYLNLVKVKLSNLRVKMIPDCQIGYCLKVIDYWNYGMLH